MEDFHSTAPMPNAVGGPFPRPFGRYELLRDLGIGGMATLYLARMRGPMGFEKLVAIKQIHPHLAGDPHFIAMFLDEARIAAQINHPNVVQIYELGELEGNYFIAMEYLYGESLAAVGNHVVKKRRRFPPAIAAHVIARVCEGLHAAHEMTDPRGRTLGIVHRDVSPHNVFISYDGSVKLLDFGVAKAVGRTSHTTSGMLKGKVAYMSPEQVLGEPLDRRSDLFALGVILYELTVGRRLFKADSDVAALGRIAECKFPHPSALVHDYPGVLEGIVLRALAKDRTQRFQTAREMLEMLDRFVELSGEHAGSAALRDLMQELFGEDIERKKSAALAALRGEPEGTVASENTQSEASLHFADTELPAELVHVAGAYRPRTRRTPALVALGLLVLVVVVALGAIAYFSTAGSVEVRSEPPGAEILVDGHGRRGRTPKRLTGLSVWAAHRIELRHAGYLPARRILRLGPGSTELLSLTLRPLNARAGRLTVWTVPERSWLDVDGERVGGGAPFRLELPTGAHVIVAHAPSGRTVARPVTIVDGSDDELWLNAETPETR